MEPDELRNALWLGALLLAITCSYTLVKTARDSLFLSNLPASSLPFVYLAVGVFALAASWLFGLLTQRMSPLRAFTVTAMASAASLVAFSAGFTQPKGWLPWLFYVWVNAYGLILVSQFWMFTNSVSDPRVAKRIFGIVGGGGILGGLIGGFAATLLAPRVPLGWMVVVGAILLAAVIPIVGLAIRRGSVRRVEEPTPEEKPKAATSVPYVRWLALAMLCSVVVTGLLDFQLKTVVQVAYPTAAQLAQFFGWFYVGVNVVALLFQLIGTRWILQRFGAGTAAGVLPIGLVAGVTGILVAPGLNSVLLTRVWDQVIRFSLNKAAVELFYFPLDAGVRRRAKAFIEAGIERFGDGIAGVLILIAGALLDTSPVTLAGIVAVLLVVWLFAWWRVRSGYVVELGRNLPRMSIDSTHGNVSLNERGVLKELVRALERPYEKVVLQSMALLEEHGGRLLTARVPKLLEHPSPKVRARALELVVAGRTTEARGQVERLLHDPDPMVRLQALRAMCALGEVKPLEALAEYLDAEDPELRGTALTCLVEFAEEGDLPAVRLRLEALIEQGTTEDIARVAEAIGARPHPSPLHDLLTPLIDSPELTVRCAALRSVGKAGMRDWVPQLIHALGVRETESAAHDGLVAFGALVVGTLGDWLLDARVSVEVRRVVPRVLGDVVNRDSIAALYRTRDRSDVLIQYRILKASNYIRNADNQLAFPVGEVTEDIDYDAMRLLKAELHAISQQGARTPAERFLLLVLNERRGQSFDRIFRRLALLYPPEPMFAAFHGLRSENSRVRGNAAEYVESVLTPEHRTLVTPLLPDAPADARLELARARYGLTQLSPQASLVRLLEDDDPWLRTCALYVAGLRRERSLAPGVESNLESQDTRVRETAGWAKLQLVRA
jgi:ATP:ADP antiporter, AAA family